MTEPRDEAIQAAAKAIYGEVSPYYLSLTRKSMAAAVPHLLDDLTQRIEAHWIAHVHSQRGEGVNDGITAALAVVEKYRNEWAGR